MSSPAQPDNKLFQAGMVLQFQPKLLINALQKVWCYVRKSLTKYDLTGNNAYSTILAWYQGNYMRARIVSMLSRFKREFVGNQDIANSWLHHILLY